MKTKPHIATSMSTKKNNNNINNDDDEYQNDITEQTIQNNSASNGNTNRTNNVNEVVILIIGCQIYHHCVADPARLKTPLVQWNSICWLQSHGSVFFTPTVSNIFSTESNNTTSKLFQHLMKTITYMTSSRLSFTMHACSTWSEQKNSPKPKFLKRER